MEDQIHVITVEEAYETVTQRQERNQKKEAGEGTENVSYWNGLNILSVVVTSVLMPCLSILVPRHNTILYPSYWYECYFDALVLMAIVSAYVVVKCFCYLDLKSIASIRAYIWLLFWTFLGISIPLSLLYIHWVYYLGYNHPMPFNAVIS